MSLFSESLKTKSRELSLISGQYHTNLNTADTEINHGVGRNSTLVCAPVMAESVDHMLVQMQKAKELGADLVELRLDFLKSFSPRFDLEIMVKQSPLPTLVTCRPIWEGGQYKGDESKRQDALCVAMEVGADFIDIELQVAHEFYDFIRGKKPEKTKIIVSSHNYQMTPSVEEIGDLVARIQATGADIAKIATTALDITESACVFQVLVHSHVPMMGLVMGEKGLISRILCAKFGGFLTFGSLEARLVSAPGQPTLNDLLQIGSDTKVHGVIGNPIGHSLSPHLYNAAFKSFGFDGIYLPLLVDSVQDFLNTYSSPDFVALNGTNRVVGSPLAGKLFVVVGAGGAGKALAYGGKEKGARVVIANRTYDKAKELASKVGGKAITLAELEHFHPEDEMILAHATSKTLKHYSLVFDAIYTPKSTRLLREAQESGAAIVYGTEMFINQAFVQFEKFTGLPGMHWQEVLEK
ncbi:hypothetical protein UlMin_029363 [Ulmus minor]